jgi:hypothetical protein
MFSSGSDFAGDRAWRAPGAKQSIQNDQNDIESEKASKKRQSVSRSRARPNVRPARLIPHRCSTVCEGLRANKRIFSQLLRNGGGGACGSRSAIRPALRCRDLEHASPIRTSAAQPARQAPLNPGLSRWLLPLVPHRTRHRFATTNASSETNAHRTTNAPRPLRSGAFTMQ